MTASIHNLCGCKWNVRFYLIYIFLSEACGLVGKQMFRVIIEDTRTTCTGMFVFPLLFTLNLLMHNFTKQSDTLQKPCSKYCKIFKVRLTILRRYIHQRVNKYFLTRPPSYCQKFPQKFLENLQKTEKQPFTGTRKKKLS